MRKIIHIFLSLVIVFGTTLSAFAASPAGWVTTPADIIINGISTTVTAIKGAGSSALQSTVQHAPTVGNIGKKIIKIGGGAAAVYAITELLGAGVDWVLDPANNRVIYYDTTNGGTGSWYYGTESNPTFVLNPSADCTAYGGIPDTNVDIGRPAVACRRSGGTGVIRWYYQDTTIKPVEKYLPISTVAAKVQSNAAAGHAPSQDLIKTVVIDDVNAGYVDNKLNVNAVPIADAPPVNPPSTDPNNPQAPAFDPSSIIAAIKSVMSAVVNMSGILGAKIDALMIDMGLKQAETIEAITAGTGEIVAANDRTGAQVAAMVAAIEAIEGNTLDGQVINDAIDRAIAAGNTNKSDIVAAIEAIEGNTLDGQVINDAVDKVIANDNVNAQATNDVVSQSIDKAIEAGQADSTEVTDAVDAQTDAITTTDPTTGEKSLSLPSFCTWASPVCTFIDWSKQQWLEFTLTFTALKDWLFEDAPADDKDNTIDTPVLPVTPVQVAINFVGSCPAPLTFEYKIYNQTFKPSVPFTPMCEVAIMINPVIKICASIAAIFIVAGIRQGNS